MILFLTSQLAIAEPTAIDARGYWVADTVSDINRSPRILYPTSPSSYDIGLMLDYALSPLVEILPEGDEAIVKSMFSQHLYGGTGLGGVRIDASLPMASYAVDLGGPYSALGDLRLGAMLPLLDMEEGWPGMAVQAVAWLPTGNSARWSGSADPASGAVLSLAQDINSRWGWSANAGARISSGYPIRNAESGSGYIGGVSFNHKLKDNLVVGLEAVSQGVSGFQNVPLEVGARMRLKPKDRSTQILTTGISRGFSQGVGSSAIRFELGLSFTPRKPQPKEMKPVVVPVFLLQENWQGPPEVKLAELVNDQIHIREPIFFKEGDINILEGSEPVLDDIRQIMLENPELVIIVEGHTNERGAVRYNQSLSERRAKSVVRWLVDAGVPQERLEYRGLGESFSIVEKGNPDAMIYNRRVEFHVRSELPEIDKLPEALRGEISAKRQAIEGTENNEEEQQAETGSDDQPPTPETVESQPETDDVETEQPTEEKAD